ncbi:MAG: hypothetical protein KJ718_05135 [Nanoarchaeota archaeon]|nr:hypothetical protein [Nanoarchaeota archaeon]MBU1051910.1 hypothetical protein [Nanoarchaeota archaeon]MBU1988953.1 hypothetical protein [Nanoarchaeota archaeon]
MTFTPVEVIALIVVIAAVVKMIVLLVNPRAWIGFAKGVYAKTGLVQMVGLILAAVVLYYLLQEITIVQVMAVVAFTALLVMVGLAPEIGHFVKKYEAQIKKGTLWKQYWLYTLIWIVLVLWAAKELLL